MFCMKNQNGSPKKVKTMNEDVMIIAYCEECGSAITTEDEAYIDHEGLYFDCIECLMSYHDIVKVET